MKDNTSAAIHTPRIAFPVAPAKFLKNAIYLLSFTLEIELGT